MIENELGADVNGNGISAIHHLPVKSAGRNRSVMAKRTALKVRKSQQKPPVYINDHLTETMQPFSIKQDNFENKNWSDYWVYINLWTKSLQLFLLNNQRHKPNEPIFLYKLKTSVLNFLDSWILKQLKIRLTGAPNEPIFLYKLKTSVLNFLDSWILKQLKFRLTGPPKGFVPSNVCFYGISSWLERKRNR